MAVELTKDEKGLIEEITEKHGFNENEVIANKGSEKGDNCMGIVTSVTVKSGDKELRGCQNDHNILDPLDGSPKTQGHELGEKELPMNSELIRSVLRKYATFHAKSIIVGSNWLHFASERYYSIWEKTDKADGHQEKFEDKVIDDREDIKEFVSEINFKKLFKNVDPEYKIVIYHGTSEPKTKPYNIKIDDWQVTHVTLPEYDFIYFFVLQSPKEILKDYRSYMKLYYDTLSEQLEKYKDERFPYSRFEEHIKQFMPIGKIMVCEWLEKPGTWNEILLHITSFLELFGHFAPGTSPPDNSPPDNLPLDASPP